MFWSKNHNMVSTLIKFSYIIVLFLEQEWRDVAQKQQFRGLCEHNTGLS